MRAVKPKPSRRSQAKAEIALRPPATHQWLVQELILKRLLGGFG